MNRNYRPSNSELFQNDNWHLPSKTIKSSAADLRARSINNNNHVSLFYQENGADKLAEYNPSEYQPKACKGSNKAIINNDSTFVIELYANLNYFIAYSSRKNCSHMDHDSKFLLAINDQRLEDSFYLSKLNNQIYHLYD